MKRWFPAHFNSNGKAKRSYRNRDEALKAYDATIIAVPQMASDTGVYQCPECGQWHIGRGGSPQ